MAAKREPYPSEMTDKEWALLKPLLPQRGKLGRPPRYALRDVLDAIFYVVRSGCTWRMMPKHYPHWRLVYYYFAKWHKDGVWARISDTLRERTRVKAGKKKPPQPRSSTARALKWLASPESVASMQARRYEDESDTFWSTPWD